MPKRSLSSSPPPLSKRLGQTAPQHLKQTFPQPCSLPSKRIKLMGTEMGLALASQRIKPQPPSAPTQALAKATDLQAQGSGAMETNPLSLEGEGWEIIPVRELIELRACKAKLVGLETAMRKAEEGLVEKFFDEVNPRHSNEERRGEDEDKSCGEEFLDRKDAQAQQSLESAQPPRKVFRPDRRHPSEVLKEYQKHALVRGLSAALAGAHEGCKP